METKPVLNYKAPEYPRIELVLTEPDMLLRNMPKAWKANKLIVTAMVTFSVAACKGQTNNTVVTPGSDEIAFYQTENSHNIFGRQIINPDTSKAAPVFVHGDGVGAGGCVMIAPPVYLSEEDALDIIITELKKEGLTFDDKYDGDSIKIIREKVDYNYDENVSNWEDRYVKSKETKNLYPDAYNKELNLIIEFVSFGDYSAYGDEEIEMSSVSDYPIIDAANKIQKAFKEQGGANSVVFYDPVGWGDRENYSDWYELEKDGRKKAVEMLKLQVADFIEWLKKEDLLKK